MSKHIIYQINLGDTTNNTAKTVVWKLIENCGYGYNHPFVFYEGINCSVNDEYGNYTVPLILEDGNMYEASVNT